MVASVQIGPPHLQAALAQHVEGLRRGDFVNQMQVDVQHRRRVGVSGTTSCCSQTFWNIVFSSAQPG